MYPLLARTQKFSEKGNAPPPFKEKESFGCFFMEGQLYCVINGAMVALQGTNCWTYRLSESQLRSFLPSL